jgi:dTDP-4-dehydrorhamnose 3,5-epimerase
LIKDVKIKKLRIIPDERGMLMEILRSDDELFERFGQVYVTTAYPDVVKAWHMHKKQTDNMTCIKGVMKVALYDARGDSETFKEINEFFICKENPMLLSIPPNVYHGFKAIGTEEAYMINIPTVLFNYKEPDEYRLPQDTKDIPYDWILAPGKKHG